MELPVLRISPRDTELELSYPHSVSHREIPSSSCPLPPLVLSQSYSDHPVRPFIPGGDIEARRVHSVHLFCHRDVHWDFPPKASTTTPISRHPLSPKRTKPFGRERTPIIDHRGFSTHGFDPRHSTLRDHTYTRLATYRFFPLVWMLGGPVLTLTSVLLNTRPSRSED